MRWLLLCLGLAACSGAYHSRPYDEGAIPSRGEEKASAVEADGFYDGGTMDKDIDFPQRSFR